MKTKCSVNEIFENERAMSIEISNKAIRQVAQWIFQSTLTIKKT
jgi:hypothetical protein